MVKAVHVLLKVPWDIDTAHFCLFCFGSISFKVITVRAIEQFFSFTKKKLTFRKRRKIYFSQRISSLTYSCVYKMFYYYSLRASTISTYVALFPYWETSNKQRLFLDTLQRIATEASDMESWFYCSTFFSDLRTTDLILIHNNRSFIIKFPIWQQFPLRAEH